jgi:hypothetical protein
MSPDANRNPNGEINLRTLSPKTHEATECDTRQKGLPRQKRLLPTPSCLRSLTSQPSITSPSGRQRNHALRQDSTPAVCPIRHHERANKKQLANMAALAASQTVAQIDSVHVCQIPLADMAELADMTAKAVGREFSPIKTQSIREHPPNPRKSASHSSPFQCPLRE